MKVCVGLKVELGHKWYIGNPFLGHYWYSIIGIPLFLMKLPDSFPVIANEGNKAW